MNTILVATDFSEASYNAALHAIELAHISSASILLVHAYAIPVVLDGESARLLDLEELNQINAENMQFVLKKLAPFSGGVSITSKLLAGSVTDCIRETENDLQDISLIVMGASGTSDSFLWGSTTLSSLHAFSHPLLIVPKGKKWEPVQNICLAAGPKQVPSTIIVDTIGKWLSVLSAGLSVIHVYNPDNPTDAPAELKQVLSKLQPSYFSLENKVTEEGIRHFVEDKHIDWLIVSVHKRGFIERLLHKSRAKKIAGSTTIPLLVLQENMR